MITPNKARSTARRLINKNKSLFQQLSNNKMKKKVLKEFTFEIDNFIKGHNNKIYKGHSNKIYITVLDYNMDGVRAQLMRKFGEIITYDILDGYAMSCYDDELDTKEKV